MRISDFLGVDLLVSGFYISYPAWLPTNYPAPRRFCKLVRGSGYEYLLWAVCVRLVAHHVPSGGSELPHAQRE